MAADIDMVIEARAALLPFGINIGLHRQGLQSGPIQAFKQVAAACTKMAADFAV